MSAASAFIEMAAERGGATPQNGQQHFDMLPGDPLTASFDECVSRSADEIGHPERWPGDEEPKATRLCNDCSRRRNFWLHL
jgi:hypothetical protein